MELHNSVVYNETHLQTKVDTLAMRLFLTTKDLKIMFTSKLKVIEIMADLGLLTFFLVLVNG